ncbi:insulator su(Hw) mRNA adaptor [Brevipalpus obovatus]|uniref:insulator su(Hw) mRNA adaptor n=1 Tax=Brevipalpus obovatus TaxID=246614 RepID=UPI003D9F2398
MELVQAFNAELSSLYEVKPPISKAKMSQITKVAIKGIKMYKHIVQSVERFITKCRPEYKIPGLYVIDSIVRQSRHQFGVDKDVFGPRFTRNFTQTFHNLFLTCPQDDKPKIVRVLNLWQRNSVFSSEVIQPLLDMANPSADLGQVKYERSSDGNTNTDLLSGIGDDENDNDLLSGLQQLASTLEMMKNTNNGNSLSGSGSHQLNNSGNSQQNAVRFNKKLLDFDYSEDEDDMDRSETPTEAEPPTSATLNNEDANNNPLALSMAQNLLFNPELLQKLQQMQQTIQQNQEAQSSQSSGNAKHSLTTDFLSSSQSTNDQSEPVAPEVDVKSALFDVDARSKDVLQVDKNVYEFSYQQSNSSQKGFIRNEAPVVSSNTYPAHQPQEDPPRSSRGYMGYRHDYDYNGLGRGDAPDSIPPKSKSPSPRRSRFSRSSYRDKDERVKRDRSRSPWRSSDRRNYESRSQRDRSDRMMSPESERREKEREKERDRQRRGLPHIRKGYLTICSTTLWLGHVPKIVSEADISNTFGEFGIINSIDLIPPRGCAYVCMNRRQDAYRALSQLKNLKLHGSSIKMAWAPGKGMKGKDYKDHWDVDLGASYIPYDKLDESVDLDLLEDGGMIDEDTVPEKLKELREKKAKEQETRLLDVSKAAFPVPVLPIQSVPAVPTGPSFTMPLPPPLVPPVAPTVPAPIAQPLPIGLPLPPTMGMPPPNPVVTGPNVQLPNIGPPPASIINASGSELPNLTIPPPNIPPPNLPPPNLPPSISLSNLPVFKPNDLKTKFNLPPMNIPPPTSLPPPSLTNIPPPNLPPPGFRLPLRPLPPRGSRPHLDRNRIDIKRNRSGFLY